MKINELIETLKSEDEQLKKVFTEISAKLSALQSTVAELKQQIEDFDLPDEVISVISQVAADVDALDNIVPDQPSPEV